MRTGRQDWRWGVAVTLGALGFALLGLGGCATGGGSRPPTPPTPQPPPVVTFAVSVTDAQTGAAIEGARVDVQWTATEDDGRTNADGYWPPPGRPDLLAPAYTGFIVQIHADGYDLGELTVPPLSDNYQATIALTPSVRPPWPGRLQVGPGGRGFVDGDGQYQLPLFKHFGEAFSRYVRDPEQIRAQERTVKQATYDGIRFWDTLGYYAPPWDGKEIMPWRFYNRDGQWQEATPDYYGRLDAFLAEQRAVGLTVHHSRGDLNSSTLDQVIAHAEQVAQLYDRLGWDALALAEGNNEDWQNGGFGPNGLRQIVAPFKARGAITALSAGFDGEEPHVLAAYAADVFYVHGARGPGYPLILRHIFSLARELLPGVPPTGWQGEPAGPGTGVTGGQVNDREMLGLMAAQAFIARQAWVMMSGCGVFYTCPLESQPGFWGVPKIRDAMEAFGRDLMTWRLTHRSASDAALRSDADLHAGDERVDQTIAPDGRVAAVVYGNTGHQSVQNVTSRTLSCDVLRVAEDESLARDTVTVPPGGWLPLAYRVGRLLLCSPVH